MRNVFTLLGLSGLCLITASHAAKGDLERCTLIKADVERLVCYDNLSSTYSVNKKISNDGRWETSVEQDPLDNSLTTVVITASVAGKNRRGQNPSLSIRCKSKEQELFIFWGVYIHRNLSLITTRIRDEDAFDANWSVSSDKRATFYPLAGDLIQKVRAGGNLVVQVVPYNENPITATFTMGGLDKALRKVKNECNW